MHLCSCNLGPLIKMNGTWAVLIEDLGLRFLSAITSWRPMLEAHLLLCCSCTAGTSTLSGAAEDMITKLNNSPLMQMKPTETSFVKRAVYKGIIMTAPCSLRIIFNQFFFFFLNILCQWNLRACILQESKARCDSGLSPHRHRSSSTSCQVTSW